MASIASLNVRIGADSYQFEQATKKVGKSLDQFGKKMEKIGKNLSMKLTAPLTIMAGVSMKLADTQAKAERKVQQAIQSTNAAAKLSFQQLAAEASRLQNNTIFGDEDILNNATAQLLTFTNIAGENFKRTQQAALDVATVLGGDLKSVTIQLGKALNDPVKNLSALSRSGIQFSKDQQKTIKTLAETNRLAEAQSIILNELNRQYGGQAAAAAQVGLGPLTQLKNMWGDLLEQFGAIVTSIVNKLIPALKSVVVWLQNLTPETKKVVVVVGGLVAAIGPLTLGFGGFIRLLPTIKTGFLALINPVSLVAAAVIALAAALYVFGKSYEWNVDRWANQRLEGMDEGAYKRHEQANQEDRKRIQEIESEKKKILEEDIYLSKRGNRAKLKGLEEERKNLLMLIDVRTQANAKYLEQQKIQSKAAEDAKKLAAEMTAQFQGLAVQVEEGTGIIARLKKQIAELEKAKSNTDDIAKIRAINTEIGNLNRQLENLNSLTDEYYKKRERYKPVASGTELATTPAAKLPGLNYKPLQNSLNDFGRVFGNTIATMQATFSKNFAEGFNHFQEVIAHGIAGMKNVSVDRMRDLVNSIGTKVVELGRKLGPEAMGRFMSAANGFAESYTQLFSSNDNAAIIAENLQGILERGANIASKFGVNAADRFFSESYQLIESGSQWLGQMLAGSLSTLGEGLGNIMTGDMGFGDVLNSILATMGDFLVSLGKQVI